MKRRMWLYLIEILHQTTTRKRALSKGRRLYLIEILHQTTTNYTAKVKSYTLYLIEILHQTTTINRSRACRCGCILLKFYIKPQRKARCDELKESLYLIEILHQTTTNYTAKVKSYTLYLIEILHQTTTINRSRACRCGCILLKFYIKPQRKARCDELKESLYLIEILHQTTTAEVAIAIGWSCILLKFYIKPQQERIWQQPR